jgi:hypothetical protein
MTVVASNGRDAHPVRLCHWWPGRWDWRWRRPEDGPPMAGRLIRQAKADRSRYLTVASVDLGGTEVAAHARRFLRKRRRK